MTSNQVTSKSKKGLITLIVILSLLVGLYGTVFLVSNLEVAFKLFLQDKYSTYIAVTLWGIIVLPIFCNFSKHRSNAKAMFVVAIINTVFVTIITLVLYSLLNISTWVLKGFFCGITTATAWLYYKLNLIYIDGNSRLGDIAPKVMEVTEETTELG